MDKIAKSDCLKLKAESDLKKCEIQEFLEKVDTDFPTSLSQKTDLHGFAIKLKNYATLCALTNENGILSLVAGYTKNTVNNMAYISIVATVNECRGKGYAKLLLNEFVEKCFSKNLNAIHLYAAKSNIGAIKLYEKFGFIEYHIKNEERPNDIHLIYYLK